MLTNSLNFTLSFVPSRERKLTVLNVSCFIVYACTLILRYLITQRKWITAV
ncbi:MAG: hypothetical protein ACTS4T_00605 [Candidatus Hodgkinia cicadicola]